jgi:hypothetical protein
MEEQMQGPFEVKEILVDVQQMVRGYGDAKDIEDGNAMYLWDKGDQIFDHIGFPLVWCLDDTRVDKTVCQQEYPRSIFQRRRLIQQKVLSLQDSTGRLYR